MIDPAILDAMVASGCSAEQIANVVKASLQASAAGRAEKQAKKEPQACLELIPVDSAPAFIELPATKGEIVSITEAEVSEWSKAFPAVNVRQQLSAMRSWLNANPKNRKTRSGMRRFVVAWLSREQDRGGNRAFPPGPHRSASPPGRERTVSDVFGEIAAGTWTGPKERHHDAEQPYIDVSFGRRN